MSAWREYFNDVANGREEMTVEEMCDAMRDGLMCAECGSHFCEAHGYPVACAFCFARLTEAEVKTMGVRLAVHEEANAAAHKQRARQRRKAQENRDRDAAGILTPEGLQVYNAHNGEQSDDVDET